MKNCAKDQNILDRALLLMEHGYFEDADHLLTGELAQHGGDADLWMAAGLARLHRKNYRSAKSAFTMSAWLGGDTSARSLAACMKKIG